MLAINDEIREMNWPNWWKEGISDVGFWERETAEESMRVYFPGWIEDFKRRFGDEVVDKKKLRAWINKMIDEEKGWRREYEVEWI